MSLFETMKHTASTMRNEAGEPIVGEQVTLGGHTGFKGVISNILGGIRQSGKAAKPD